MRIKKSLRYKLLGSVFLLLASYTAFHKAFNSQYIKNDEEDRYFDNVFAQFGMGCLIDAYNLLTVGVVFQNLTYDKKENYSYKGLLGYIGFFTLLNLAFAVIAPSYTSTSIANLIYKIALQGPETISNIRSEIIQYDHERQYIKPPKKLTDVQIQGIAQ